MSSATLQTPDPGERPVSLIVIHCSATPNGRWYGPDHIDRWHEERGFRRSAAFRARQNPSLGAIGYHFLIGVNGALWTGRHLDEPGAHAIGVNQVSVGICLIGTNRFPGAQWDTLRDCVRALARRYLLPEEFAPVRSYGRRDGGICGHRDLDQKRDCPGFDVAAWLARGMAPREDAVMGARDA